MNRLIKKLTVFLSFLCIVAFAFIIYGDYKLPEKIRICDGGGLSFFKIYKTEMNNDVYPVFNSETESVDSITTVNLLGILPVKNCEVKTASRDYVALGGDLIGIRIYSDGVVVLANENLSLDGTNVNPGEKAGLQKGDIIISVNGKKISTCYELTECVNSSQGQKITLGVNRDGNILSAVIEPVYSQNDKKYHIGLWVRDSSAGIGTMTFIDTKTCMFASLGHAVCDSDTNIILPVGGGDILNATVKETVKGQVGATGEIKGSFGNKILGELLYNGNTGIYGKYTANIDNVVLVPVAEKNEIQTGYAQIVSTVENGKKEYYDINIEKIDYSDSENAHNMTIKVTDAVLLEKTGGIIQGMSGSPIIQNGKLVGAITHVFMNNPQMGYGIFARTMLDNSDYLYETAA